MEEPKIAVSCVMEDGRAGGHPAVPRAFSEIESWANVTYLDAAVEHPDLDWTQFDLYRKEKRTEAAMNDLRRAVDHGIPTVNPLEGTMMVVNRPSRYRELHNHVPMPYTEYCPVMETSISPPAILKEETQIIDRGGLTQEVVSEDRHLDREDERLVQEYIDFDTEYKGYQFGDEFRLTERFGPTSEDRREVRSGDAYETVRDISYTVRDVSGLNIFGVDVIMADEQPYLVDVNEEGSYRGVEDAVDLYVQTIWEQARDAVSGSDRPERAPIPRATVSVD
ncbi:MAG: hypothetical protein SVW02_01055 [Candidatus Nanohaloarchaea archaeon]|nr:hypothetical protein [Candidatus Nanohaloarchaea archaeon]